MSTSRSTVGSTEPTEPARPHHRVHVVSLAGKPGETVTLPLAFSVPVRPDLIRRAVVAAQSHRIQPHGTTPTAGARHSVRWSGKGKGVARTPRLMDSMRGAQAPNTVGGRPAHPPKVETLWRKKINVKERRRAFAAALAATRDLSIVRARGHRVGDETQLPVVVEDPIEAVDSSKTASEFLRRLGLLGDVDRARDGTHIRAGRGKRRGRLRREPSSLLVVTSVPGRARGFRNLAGVDVVPVGRLGTEDLAPGGDPGRLTIYSSGAIAGLKARLEGGVA
ncbi:MAG: 50S ribosomal protein L4 [Thermoplasmata archaeon]|nr:50S ribosomal protein L4 [Thermoplasmata archaeon]